MLETVYDFWQANPQLWFNSTAEDDDRITKEFSWVFKYVTDNSITADIIFDVKQWTGYVILYDQILRHVNRVSEEKITPPATLISDCYAKYNDFGSSLTNFEFAFCLLPLRHTHDMKHVSFVISESWRRLETSESPEIKKYLTATYERYAKLCINRDADNLVSHDNEHPHPFNPEVMSILDNRCNNYIPNKLMDILYFRAKPLVCKMRDYVTKHNLTKERITISLSGGVDSMVCSYLLAAIGQPMQAVHINYNNRVECALEEDLIMYWCKLLGIPLYIRRLTEINRPKCMEYNMRDVYESYTRDMRFYAYTNTGGYVMLGHNKDDTIENILTNTASQSHYENLCGMTEYSTQDHYGQSITFLRPLLATMKQEIYTFAEEANIPFLVDSTPKWSQRGKIRDIIRPALESWNPMIIPGMLELSAKMTEMSALLDTLIPKTIPEFSDIMAVPTNNMYWEQVFKKHGFGHGLGLGLFITQKTMTCWIEKIEYLQKYPNKLILNQPVKFIICKNKIITITKMVVNVKITIQ
jgi:tRNA(Ile)-lysidine synthetase-like protein